MAKLSKRAKAIREKLEAGKFYNIDEALELLKSMPPVKLTVVSSATVTDPGTVLTGASLIA